MGCIPERFRKQRCLAMDDRKKEQLKNAVAEALQPGRRGSTAVYVIIAVLLIILGLTIVVNSLRALNKAEKNSEKAA